MFRKPIHTTPALQSINAGPVDRDYSPLISSYWLLWLVWPLVIFLSENVAIISDMWLHKKLMKNTNLVGNTCCNAHLFRTIRSSLDVSSFIFILTTLFCILMLVGKYTLYYPYVLTGALVVGWTKCVFYADIFKPWRYIVKALNRLLLNDSTFVVVIYAFVILAFTFLIQNLDQLDTKSDSWNNISSFIYLTLGMMMNWIIDKVSRSFDAINDEVNPKRKVHSIRSIKNVLFFRKFCPTLCVRIRHGTFPFRCLRTREPDSNNRDYVGGSELQFSSDRCLLVVSKEKSKKIYSDILTSFSESDLVKTYSDSEMVAEFISNIMDNIG